MLGSMLVAVAIVIITIAVVSSRLGVSPELREEQREEEEEAREDRQDAVDERREGNRGLGALLLVAAGGQMVHIPFQRPMGHVLIWQSLSRPV